MRLSGFLSVAPLGVSVGLGLLACGGVLALRSVADVMAFGVCAGMAGLNFAAFVLIGQVNEVLAAVESIEDLADSRSERVLGALRAQGEAAERRALLASPPDPI